MGHVPLFTLIALTSIVCLAISAALVTYYNDNGYPPRGAYKPRIRILLVASVWTVVISLYLLFGFLFKATSILFGVVAHWVPLTISFILFLIGSASTTALTNGTDCGNAKEGFKRCNIVKGLVVVSWIDTIFVFIAWLFVTYIAWRARRTGDTKRNTLLDV